MAPTKERNKTSLVIGAGEIGSSIYTVIKDFGETYIRDLQDKELPNIDVLHIAIPYTAKFEQNVKGYIEQYDPKLTIVYSSTPIGTCESIGDNIVHSPVEGRHPNLEDGIRIGARWIGCKDMEALRAAVEFWELIHETIRPCHSASITEMLKMRSTAKYGVNLVWADYEKTLVGAVEAEWEMVKVFDFDYNYLYEATGWPQFSRYILDPPNGEIGGHCVVPNAELLDKQFPHPMLKMIKKMKKKEKSDGS